MLSGWWSQWLLRGRAGDRFLPCFVVTLCWNSIQWGSVEAILLRSCMRVGLDLHM